MKSELEKVIENIFIRTFTGECDQKKYPYASMSFYMLEDALRENGIDPSGGFSLKAASNAYYWTGLSCSVVIALEALIQRGRITIFGLSSFYYQVEWWKGRRMKELPGMVWIPSQLMLVHTPEELEYESELNENKTAAVMPWMAYSSQRI